MLSRVLFGIILVISAFVFQWWISVGLSIIGLLYFKRLYEVIAVGIILDSLYGKNFDIPFIESFDFPITIILMILLFVSIKMKNNLLITR